MKLINLILAALLSITFSYAKEEIDCSDPKNRPRFIGGVMISEGKKECDVNRGTAERAKRELDLTIGRNPVTGQVTSKAKLAEANNATANLEKAQMNYGKRKYELEEAEKTYAKNNNKKNSQRLDKARKSFEKAQRDLEAAEEIKSKADKAKGK